MNNDKTCHRVLRLLTAAALSLTLVAAAPAQDAGAADSMIEIVRQGIPHDALYALEMSGEWGLAVGAFGLMLETNDGGGTWNLLPPKTPLGLFGVSKAGDRYLVVGQQGLVMTRAGEGDWTVVESGFSERLLNVDLAESGLAVAVGEFGFIVLSRDAGQSWERITLDWMEYNEEGYEPHLYDAKVQQDGSLLIAGEFGLILRSTDQGQTWGAVNAGDQSVFDMHFARDGSNTAYAVGQEGYIVKSTDGGLSWRQIEVDTNANLLGVWSGNSEVVVTGIREMLRSSDDGATWTKGKDLEIIRTWYQGVAAGVSETQAGERGFLRQQSVYAVGHRASIARVIK